MDIFSVTLDTTLTIPVLGVRRVPSEISRLIQDNQRKGRIHVLSLLPQLDLAESHEHQQPQDHLRVCFVHPRPLLM
jgi:hypothetical protein